MTPLVQRQKLVALIEQARSQGARPAQGLRRGRHQRANLAALARW